MTTASIGTAAQAVSLQSSVSIKTFTVVDTAANIAAAFDSLNAATKLTMITVSPAATLPLTYAQFIADAVALGKLATGTKLTVTAVSIAGATRVQANAAVSGFAVADTAANILAGLAALSTDGKLSSITIIGGSALSVSFAQYTTYGKTLALLTTGNTLVVTGATVANAASLQAATGVSGFTVVDTAANLLANLPTLAAESRLSAMTLSGGTSLAVSGTQYASYMGTLDKLTAGATLTVSAASATTAGALQADVHVGAFAVTDTAANVVGGIGGLSLDGKLTAITLSGGTSATVSYAQYQANKATLDKFVAGDTILVTGVSAAGAVAVAADPHVSGLTVSDSLANIGTYLGSLQTLVAGGKATAIAVADTGQNLALTGPQATADAAALKLMTGSFTVTRPVINLIWDASVANAPAGFKGAIQDAANYLDALITSPITVNIEIGYGEFAGAALPTSTLGETAVLSTSTLTLSQFKADLAGLPTSAILQTAIANLSTPGSPSTLTVAAAEAKALGAMPAYGTEIDAAVGFETDPTGRLFTYDPNHRGVLGQVDLIAVAEHELSHALGRLDIPGQSTPLDLYRYSAPGVIAAPGATSYFSINGGVTNLNNFATSGDTADWASTAGNDANNATINTGYQDLFTAADVTEMNALGFSIASNTPSSSATIEASAAGGLNAATLSFIGTPIVLTMGTATTTASVAIPPAAGIEEINSFTYGTDKLTVNLSDLSGSVVAFDTTIGTIHAVALTGSNDLMHGIVFTGMAASNTAANLLSSHLTIAGGIATIT